MFLCLSWKSCVSPVICVDLSVSEGLLHLKSINSFDEIETKHTQNDCSTVNYTASKFFIIFSRLVPVQYESFGQTSCRQPLSLAFYEKVFVVIKTKRWKWETCHSRFSMSSVFRYQAAYILNVTLHNAALFTTNSKDQVITLHVVNIFGDWKRAVTHSDEWW